MRYHFQKGRTDDEIHILSLVERSGVKSINAFLACKNNECYGRMEWDGYPTVPGRQNATLDIVASILMEGDIVLTLTPDMPGNNFWDTYWDGKIFPYKLIPILEESKGGV